LWSGLWLTLALIAASPVVLPRTLPSSSAQITDLLPDGISDCAFPPQQAAVVERHSIYVPMTDGTRLAIDIYLPKGSERPVRVPTLFTATRYWRSARNSELTEVQKQWVASGFALVTADVRGTGASFGQWYVPYSPQEARDLGFLAHWIAKQPWSNGRVVMSGTSYTATTPFLAVAYSRGAITAIAPKFSDFDMYTDLLWPGGVTAEGLIVTWGQAVRQLDLNQASAIGPAAQEAVRPVDGPDGLAQLDAAVKEHQTNSWSFEHAASTVTFNDQPLPQAANLTIADGGVYRYRKEIERSRVPIFGWGSWLDSGIAQGLLNRFMTFKNPQLTVIGPWTHGARANANPFNINAPLDPSGAMQQRMIYCYLNRYAHDSPPTSADHTLIYFTMGEDRWKRSAEWPIPGTREARFYLDAGRSLSTTAPAAAGRDEYRVDFEASTGPSNRWATQAGTPTVDYGDRSRADTHLLAYTSEPLATEMEVTGQPVVTLQAASTHSDGNVIVYLEDVAPDGRVTYVSEGELRALDRKLSSETPPYRITYPYRTFNQTDALPLVPGQVATLTFELQATSVLIKAKHRLRVAIAGADKGTFLRVPAIEQGDVTLDILWGGGDASFIALPVAPIRSQ